MIFERKLQSRERHSSGYGERGFVSLQPKRAVFEPIIIAIRFSGKGI